MRLLNSGTYYSQRLDRSRLVLSERTWHRAEVDEGMIVGLVEVGHDDEADGGTS